MTLPALHRLRERFPAAEIAVFTHPILFELWQACPSVDSAIAFVPGESPFSAGRRLRVHNADTALVLPNSLRAALEVWAAGIPRRVGYARPWRNWFLSQAVLPRSDWVPMRKRTRREIKRLLQRKTPERPPASASARNGSRVHQLHDYLHLIGALGACPEPLAPRLELPKRELEDAIAIVMGRLGALYSQRGLPSSPVLLGMNASAAYGPAKQWPAASFAAAASEICRVRRDVFWLAFGNSSTEKLYAEIAAIAKVPIINLAGKTTLRELMRFLSLATLLLTNDSGPMHLAAALGTPVVVPFGSTSPKLTGPGLPGDPKHRVLTAAAACAPCFRRSCPVDLRCMTGIGVQQVVGAVLDCLEKAPRRSLSINCNAAGD